MVFGALRSSETAMSSRPVDLCSVTVTSFTTGRWAGEWSTTAMQSVPCSGCSQVELEKLTYLTLAAKSVKTMMSWSVILRCCACEEERRAVVASSTPSLSSLASCARLPA